MLVVSFYTPRPELEKLKAHGSDYDELLMLVEASCRRYGLKHLVISDSPRPKPLNTFLCALPHNLMKAFIVGQGQVLKEVREPVLFIGADCLFTKDPRKLLSNEADMTITLGPFWDCEMNTGAIWCHEPERCYEVWFEALERPLKDWGDDQIAMYHSVKLLEATGQLDVNRVRCEDHNWHPEPDEMCNATVVHFRGSRKQFMIPWAKEFLDLEPIKP